MGEENEGNCWCMSVVDDVFTKLLVIYLVLIDISKVQLARLSMSPSRSLRLNACRNSSAALCTISRHTSLHHLAIHCFHVIVQLSNISRFFN